MIGGIVFVVVWLALCAVWFVMSLMAGAMANDAGTVAPEIHARLLILLMLGELAVAIAGIAGGSSFIFAEHGGLLWKIFWGLLALGVGAQVWAIASMAMRA